MLLAALEVKKGQRDSSKFIELVQRKWFSRKTFGRCQVVVALELAFESYKGHLFFVHYKLVREDEIESKS